MEPMGWTVKTGLTQGKGERKKNSAFRAASNGKHSSPSSPHEKNPEAFNPLI
jgi:hypothetical protein